MLRETADVVLRGGTTVHVRPVEPGDVDAIVAFLEGLSPESRYLRFFGGGVDVRRAARNVTEPREGMFALAAFRGPAQQVVGLAELARIDDTSAEVAFAIADSLHGQGLGTVLLAHLAQHARDIGIERLVAHVMRGNVRMANVFRDSGFAFAVRSDEDGLRFEAPATLTPDGLARFEERQRAATAASVGRVLRPTSVAVIGTGDRADRVRASLRDGGYMRRILDTLDEDPVDLVVVTVPAAEVLDVAEQAAERGCGAMLVLSGGFAEVGPDGAARQRRLLDICRDAGMRLVGPNCLGVANTDPEVRLNATEGIPMPPRGNVALLTQSGALGIALLERAEFLGLGLSSFVSVGNKADLSGNDLLQFWELDACTEVVLLYLESFGNPRNFARIARRIGQVKPIVAVKSGRTRAGARATASHTGSLLASSDVSVDALFRQAGVVRASTLSEFLDVGALLSRQPLPAGPRVAIVTDAGGPGVLAADACEAMGLEVPEPPDELVDELRTILPPEASLANPVDVLATAAPHDFQRVVAAIERSGFADAVIAIAVHAPAAEALGSAGALPLLVVQMAGERRPRDGGPPVYRFPEDAARALARAVEYGRWRARPRGEVPELADVRRDQAATLLAGAAASGPRWLDPTETAELLACWGLPLVPGHRVAGVDGVAEAAEAIAGPVAVKAVVPGLVDKAEAGGVVLDVSGGREAAAAAREIAARLDVEGFLVQPMITGGVEMLVGVTHDRLFGPVVACGPGGERAELERDVAVRLTPLTSIEAAEMVRSLRTFPILEGWKGAPRLDVPALEDLVVRLALLADTHPEVHELDLDPVKVLPRGAAILDARVRVAAPEPEPLWPAIGASPPRASTLGGSQERWPSG